MPNGIKFGQQVPQQVDPNILSILRAALIGTGRDIGGLFTRGVIPGAGTRVPPVQAGVGLPGQLGAAGRGILADITARQPGPSPLDVAAQQALQAPQQAIAGFTGQPFVPPTAPGGVGAIPSAQAAPQAGILPQRLPPTPPSPTGEQPQGVDKRQLLATAIQIGLPLALAGFGGRTGLAVGAGLATGFGEAAKTRAELAEKKAEREATEKIRKEQIEIDKRLANIKEIIAAAQVTPEQPGKFLGLGKRPPTQEEVLATREELFRPGEEIAERVQKVTKKTLPKGISEEDIKFTMKKHGLSREEVLQRLR